jgi:hypothetical protein
VIDEGFFSGGLADDFLRGDTHGY